MGEELNVTGQTIVHPLGLTVLIVMGILTLLLPRKYALFPIIVVSALISPGQRIIIGTANFPFLRIMLIFAVVRMLIRGEFSSLKLSAVDCLILAYAFFKMAVYTLQWQTVAAFIFQAGQSYDVFGFYFFFRCLVRSFADLRGLAFNLALIAVPVSIAFFIESQTGTNMFAALGGVPFMTEVREGKIRCQGAFPHAIMAGVYFASNIPLIAARWFDNSQSKLMTIFGAGCSFLIVLMTNSSTSVMAFLFAVVGISLFPLRKKMRQIRWCILFALILAQFTLKGGAIYLVSRVNILGGSTGWQRSYLMDRCIVYFPEWAILGTRDSKHWAAGEMGGLGLGDVNNQYILEGIRGGLVTMVLFVAVIALTYRNIGRMLRSREVVDSRSKTIYIYSLGVILLVHTASFFSVSYFGQTLMLIWLVVAVTAGLSQTIISQDLRSARATGRSNLKALV